MTYQNDYQRTRDIVRSLRASWPELSYRALAAGLGVSHPTVSKVHERMQAGAYDGEEFMRCPVTWTPDRRQAASASVSF